MSKQPGFLTLLKSLFSIHRERERQREKQPVSQLIAVSAAQWNKFKGHKHWDDDKLVAHSGFLHMIPSLFLLHVWPSMWPFDYQ